LFDADDGLGYALLAPFCPDGPLRIDDASGAMVCQQQALDCTTTRAIAMVAPAAALMLADVGVAPGCLGTATCGDGIVDDTEDCDDGADNSDVLPDRCRTTCVDPDCGDGVVDEDEDCDDGNTVDGDGCDADCGSEADACGNGVVDEDEECDDGNATAGDGCDDECSHDTSVCGDGIESDDEECDEGAANSDVLPDHCRTTCSLPSCGDGIVDPDEGEECEPPGTLLCTATCESRIQVPFDRVQAAPESAARCGRAILSQGFRMFTVTRAGAGACARAAARCVLSDEATERCVAAAAEQCHRAAARRDRLRTATRAAAGRICESAAMTLPMLLDPRNGLDFRDVAAGCPFDAARPPTTDDLLDVHRTPGCLGERTSPKASPSSTS
jgi:cysteine-rich repeat protein